jgi:hypothetical protein
MLPHNLELIIALAVPLIVLTVLRVNAALVFMSLCLGYVLVELVAKDPGSLVNFLTRADSFSQATWQLGMLFLPVVLTSVFTAFSIHGHWRTMVNVVPAIAVSALGVLLAVPLVTPGLREAIQDGPLWPIINDAQPLVVSVGAFVSLVTLWSQRKSGGKSGHHR